MSSRPPRAPFQRLRRALLLSLALAVAALGALYWLGRQGAPAAVPAATSAPGEPRRAPTVAPDRQAVAASEGFEFEQRVEGRRVFRIAGDRFQAAREGRVRIESVTLEVDRDGEPYRVTAREALYDPETQAAELTGGVEISGGDGFALTTSALDLAPGGQELVSRSAVELRQGEAFAGEAAGLRLDFAHDLYALTGPAHLRGAGDPALDLVAATRIVFQRRRHVARAEGDVVLARGEEQIDAQQLALFFAADDRTPRAVQAKWEVSGALLQTDAAGAPVRVEFRAKQADLDFEGLPARPARIALEAERGEQVRLFAPGPEGTTREIAARYLVATLAEGKLAAANGFQPVYFAEYPVGSPDRPLRTGRADQVDVEFDAEGRPARLTFVGHVSFAEARLEGEGERGFFDLERGRAELFGKKVRVATDRGELTGPHLAWDRRRGLVTADGGVQARLEARSAGLLAGAQAGARGPVRVDAEEAIYQERPRGFVFRGRVQAWQGESVLFAEQLRGEEAEERLSAGGGVRTVWREAGAGGAAAEQTEIRSETLSYRRRERSLVYAGDVRMTQGERTLTCRELEALLGEEDRVRRMIASGGVRLEAAADGRSVEGERAEYDLEAKSAVVTGQPVVMRDGQGTTIRGPRLVYDLATGSARMLAEAR